MNVRQWDTAIATVTADRLLAQSTKLITYPIGETAPPPATPLGPTKMEIEGVMRDTSGWSYEEKEEALLTGKMPKSRVVGGELGSDPRRIGATVRMQ